MNTERDQSALRSILLKSLDQIKALRTELQDHKLDATEALSCKAAQHSAGGSYREQRGPTDQGAVEHTSTTPVSFFNVLYNEHSAADAENECEEEEWGQRVPMTEVPPPKISNPQAPQHYSCTEPKHCSAEDSSPTSSTARVSQQFDAVYAQSKDAGCNLEALPHYPTLGDGSVIVQVSSPFSSPLRQHQSLGSMANGGFLDMACGPQSHAIQVTPGSSAWNSAHPTPTPGHNFHIVTTPCQLDTEPCTPSEPQPKYCSSPDGASAQEPCPPVAASPYAVIPWWQTHSIRKSHKGSVTLGTMGLSIVHEFQDANMKASG